MAIREDVIDFDVRTGTISRSFSGRILGEGDEKGDLFGVRISRDGEPVDLSGLTTIGYFQRADGTTMLINGYRTGNFVYVILPDSAYAVPGVFQLAIKVTGDGTTSTVRIVDGTIVDTITGAIVDPGGVIPDLDDYAALVERAEDASEAIEGLVITSTQITGTRYRTVVTTPA